MLIKIVLLSTAAIGVLTVIVVREKEPPKPPPPAELRQPTAQERKVLNSLTTVAPHAQGVMH